MNFFCWIFFLLSFKTLSCDQRGAWFQRSILIDHLLISCDNGTRKWPWSAASGKKSSNPRQIRGTQDQLPRVALESPWWPCFWQEEQQSSTNTRDSRPITQSCPRISMIIKWVALTLPVLEEVISPSRYQHFRLMLLFLYGIWQVFANVGRRLTHAAW